MPSPPPQNAPEQRGINPRGSERRGELSDVAPASIPLGHGLQATTPSNRRATRHATGDLQQVGLHVEDLVVAVPFAQKEVLQAVRLEPDGAVDELVLFGPQSFWPDLMQADHRRTPVVLRDSHSA